MAQSPAPDPDRPAPKRGSRLRRILREHPEARERIGRAVGGLLTAVLATLAAVGVFSIWHLRRRADMIRDRLGAGRGGSPLDRS